MTAASSPAAPSPTARADVTAWFALSPEDALRQQGVEVDAGLTSAEADARRAKVGPNTFAAAKKTSRATLFIRQYADPMQVVLLIAGVICLFLPGQFFTGLMLILLTLCNAVMAMNQEGKASAGRGRPELDAVRQGQDPPQRRARRPPDGPAGPGRHRQHRGRRPRPGRLADPDRGDPGDRRVGPHRRERAHPQAGRRGGGRRRPRRPRGHGVHELPGHPRRRHDPRRDDGHGDRGRPHQRHAHGHGGREDAADEAARRADAPDPGPRRLRADGVDPPRHLPRRADARSCSSPRSRSPSPPSPRRSRPSPRRSCPRARRCSRRPAPS